MNNIDRKFARTLFHRIGFRSKKPQDGSMSVLRLESAATNYKRGFLSGLTRTTAGTGSSGPATTTARSPLKAGLGKLPIHQLVKEGRNELRTSIAVIDVIGMFPNVQCENRLGPLGKGRTSVRRIHDVELTFGGLHKPRPTRTKVTGSCRRELLLKAAKLPHLALMASASAPVGSPPPLGVRHFQK